ncbi:YjbH domain-containing protein [Bacteroides fragilis]|nr:YjbH domain-containing protein [Bacteroides fragilis]
MKNRWWLILGLCWLYVLNGYAQLTDGTTGLLHIPTADMQKDKTLMLGGGLVNKRLLPNDTWFYNTYNYYLNVTILPCLEISYTCTLFRRYYKSMPEIWGKFRGQDRHFSVRLRVWKESRYWPSVVVGTADPITGLSSPDATGNGHLNRYYLALTKHTMITDREEIGIHVTYLYNRRKDYPLNGMALGVNWHPSAFPNLNIMADYDTKYISYGAEYLFFGHFNLMVVMTDLKYPSVNLTYKLVLK